MLQATFIMIGLSLDAFIVMMQKGATIRTLKFHDALIYALLFAGVNTGALLVGYMLAPLLDGMIPDGKIEIIIACLIVILIGNVILVKTILQNNFVEKLDKNFNLKEVLRLALVTSADILFMGIGLALLDYPIGWMALISFCVGFISIYTAWNVGYHLGAGCQKPIGISGGILMILFGLIVMITTLQR